ncbi:hypothetical protein [Burkholderia sp. 22PA0106]|uniref:hypothetical protein n=1 Tax=Burkholderia sp. 22PA0106 TaxID=3237371 RepID=UPI0039C373A1
MGRLKVHKTIYGVNTVCNSDKKITHLIIDAQSSIQAKDEKCARRMARGTKQIGAAACLAVSGVLSGYGSAAMAAGPAFMGYEYNGADYCVNAGATSFASGCSLWSSNVTGFTGSDIAYLSGSAAVTAGGYGQAPIMPVSGTARGPPAVARARPGSMSTAPA